MPGGASSHLRGPPTPWRLRAPCPYAAVTAWPQGRPPRPCGLVVPRLLRSWAAACTSSLPAHRGRCLLLLAWLAGPGQRCSLSFCSTPRKISDSTRRRTMPRMSGSSGMPKPSPTAAIEAAVEAAVGALPGVSAAAAAAPPLPAGWATQLSRSTGRTYYVHVATGRTQYELPGGEDLDSISGADDSGADVTGGEGVGTAVSPTAVDRQWLGSEQPPPPSLQLPPGWTSQISRSTGDTYYVHTETGHSQYEWPSDELGAPGDQTASEPPQPEPEPDLAPREGTTPAPTSSAPSAVPGEGTPAVDDGDRKSVV